MEKNTNINTDEREMDLKILFAYVFKEWRKILIGGLVFCVLFVAYKGYKLVKENSSASTATTVVMSDEQKQSIKETTSSIEYLNDYIKNSIYANIDPYNEAVTTSTISIITSSNDKIATLFDSTNHANQIVQAYSTYIMSEIDYSSLANTLGTTEQNLDEVISTKTDYDADTVTLRVIGADKKQTEEISDFIIKAVNAEETNIKNQFGEYTPSMSKLVTNVIVDQGLISPVPAPVAGSTPVYMVNVAMNNALTKRTALETSLKTQQSATTPVTTPAASPIKNSLKYGLIGLIVGMLFMILLYIIKIMTAGRIVTENDLKEIYRIRILSVLPMNISIGNKSKVDKSIYREIDSAYGVGKDVCLQKAITNITGYASDMKSILIIGSDVTEDVNSIVADLQKLNGSISFNSSSEINADAAELRKLKDSDGVILLTQRNSTRINELTKTIETIENWGKPVIGSIVL